MIKNLIYTFSTIANPYKVLGINKGASIQEIKSAYYKLAQLYHPDKNNAKDAAKMFTQVNNAYEILSDENKKRMYDTCGVQDDNSNEQDFEDELRGNANGYQQKAKRKQSKGKYYSKFHQAEYETIFNEFDQFFQQKHGKKKAYYAKKKGDDIKLGLKLSFKDSVFGGKHLLSYRRQKTCDTCKGSRCAPGKSAQKCFSCGGSGWLFYVDGGSSMEVKCNNCDGWGKVVRDPCLVCEGSGIVEKEFDVEIELPKGIQNGTIIRQTRYGHASKYSGEPGDLLIEVEVEEDNTLRRDGNNIISELELSVSEMVLGCKKQIQTIWGALEISIPGAQQPRTKLQIPQYGIQYGQSQWKKGDHIVILNLEIPQQLNERTKQLYYELLKQL
ncbi:unnamed protein product [Paramecium sonneborni]|uniref:Uncharacterized protein n=1 Tax=Paramecium sonneborni TaxID=65129 RepID=A0A8S1QEA6_9CILI|nr:unnamed protein product [Paramecium sonneborni]